MIAVEAIKKFYIQSTGYSYTNLGRMFLRLFVGIMLLQFGIRQIAHFYEMRDIFPAIWGMPSETSLILMTTIEVVCALFIMAGFLTRMMVIPPLVAMIVAEVYLLNHIDHAAYLLNWQQQGYLPIMFIGIFFFMLLTGPGKISVDYFLSLHFIHSSDSSESELEEV